MGPQRSRQISRRTLVFGVAAASVATSAPAVAQEPYPTRPVHFIVPSGPGSGTDIITRILGEKLTQRWGQAVIVENRDGASGFIGTELTVKAPPDGYTLCMGFTGPLAAGPAFLRNAPYDPLKDLAPITLIDSSPAILVINDALPVKSVQELIAYAKSNPGTLSYGSAGQGTIGHVSGALFNLAAGTKMLHVPYKNVSQAVTDVVSGTLQVLFHVAPAVMPLVKSGQLRAIGVTSLKRWSIAPDLPSIAEVALPRYQSSVWHGVVMPSGSPRWLIDKVYQDIAAAMSADEVRARFEKEWIEPLGTAPDEFATFLKSEVQAYAKLANSGD